MKIITHNTVPAEPIWKVIQATIKKPLRQYIEAFEVQFTPTKVELHPKDEHKENLQHTYGVWEHKKRRIRIFLWPMLNRGQFTKTHDSLRYQLWERIWETAFHELGHAASYMTQLRDYWGMIGASEEALARQYSQRLMLQAEFRGLLTPPRNMGLIDRQMSSKIQRVLDESAGISFSQEPRLYRFYRELIMRKLNVHHTVGKLVDRLEEKESDSESEFKFSNLMNYMDRNGQPNNYLSTNPPRELYKGFLRDKDSYRTKCRVIRSLAEEMRLGKTYIDGAGRTQLFLPHQDYAALLNVIFYSGK